MKFRGVIVVLLLCFTAAVLFLRSASGLAAAVESHCYEEATGAERHIFAWRLTVGEQAVITSTEENKRFRNVCDLSGVTRGWEMQQGGHTDVQARREGNVIVLSGTCEGVALDRRLPVDDAPWLQPLSYSFRSFIAGEDDEIEFWTIRPDKLKAVKMKAERREIESLMVDGRPVAARKVRISLTGLMGRLWAGYYWFRCEDGLFLRYEGVHGPPGTPKTLINLYAREGGC
ncbi:MAG: hypothetical protein JW781_04250 [Deltaproteobacteria bacterium]|nr:hypothetical protein [Candidatus Anaeroferrophillacea bacterium]